MQQRAFKGGGAALPVGRAGGLWRTGERENHDPFEAFVHRLLSTPKPSLNVDCCACWGWLHGLPMAPALGLVGPKLPWARPALCTCNPASRVVKALGT